ncbi:MAG: hypothetical protein ACP5VE_09065 [Chthonomonadales bacterium]
MERRSLHSLWKALQAVPFTQIEEEARRPFSLALVGSKEQRESALSFLFPVRQGAEIHPSRSLVLEYGGVPPNEGRAFDAIVVAGEARPELVSLPNAYHLAHLGDWARLFDRMLQDRPDLAASMARRLPGLRSLASAKVITDAARANAKFAFSAGLPEVFPLTEILIPATVLADFFVITRNQAEMLLRLAAIHDLPANPAARAHDLVPLLGNALGWRALARAATALVPGGVGLVANAVFAYAGTIALGRSLELYYRTGIQPQPAVVRRLFREGLAEARRFVAHIRLNRLRR